VVPQPQRRKSQPSHAAPEHARDHQTARNSTVLCCANRDQIVTGDDRPFDGNTYPGPLHLSRRTINTTGSLMSLA
jgi:hypothetical protein